MFDLERRTVISEDCWTEPVFVGNLRGTGNRGLKAQHIAQSYGVIVLHESGAHRMSGPSVSAASHKLQASFQLRSSGAPAKPSGEGCAQVPPNPYEQRQVAHRDVDHIVL